MRACVSKLCACVHVYDVISVISITLACHKVDVIIMLIVILSLLLLDNATSSNSAKSDAETPFAQGKYLTRKPCKCCKRDAMPTNKERPLQSDVVGDYDDYDD